MHCLSPNKVGIYKITNPNNEVYIGATRNFKRRIKEYRSGKTKEQRLIHESINKFGLENHSIHIVHELPTDISQAVLNTYEQLYMDSYKQAGVGLLNLQDAGSGNHCEETKIRMRSSHIGNRHSEETKAKIGDSNKGKKMSDASKAKIRIARAKQLISEETKAKLSAANSGGGNATAKRVINIETGAIYDCVKYAAKENGVKYWTLQYYLNGRYPNKTPLRYL